MKIFKKRFILPVAIIGSAIVGGSIVYAFTSSNYASRAQTWATKVCTQSLLNSKDTTENDRTATICYNYYEDQQQDASINNLNDTSGPVLHDANNNILGAATAPYDQFSGIGGSFYDSSLRLAVNLNTDGTIGNEISPYFTSSNCSGTPYIPEQAVGTTYLASYPTGISSSDSQVNYFEASSSTQTVNVNSQLMVGNPNTCNVVNSPNGDNLVVQTPISITPNFSIPVAEPTHY